eukprot:COSAG01_NODE_2029_length_8590_cov_5.719501_9_plen_76_part_00
MMPERVAVPAVCQPRRLNKLAWMAARGRYYALGNQLEVAEIYSVMSLLNALRLALGKKFTRAMETVFRDKNQGSD